MPPLFVDVFCVLDAAVRQSILMHPRSPSDKEYMAQDWFSQQMKSLSSVQVTLQGRNSYPDFWVAGFGEVTGFEIKSLAFTKSGKPARKDIDFNSTIPSGTRQGRDVFLVMFLYTGENTAPRSVHTLIVTHGNVINADSEIAEQHENVAIHGFGSYGDGFIRDRKMYVLPHPATIYPKGLGQTRLIVPSEWHVSDSRVRRVDTFSRTVVKERLVKYTVSLKKEPPSHVTEPAPSAGSTIPFDVFEAV